MIPAKKEKLNPVAVPRSDRAIIGSEIPSTFRINQNQVNLQTIPVRPRKIIANQVNDRVNQLANHQLRHRLNSRLNSTVPIAPPVSPVPPVPAVPIVPPVPPVPAVSIVPPVSPVPPVPIVPIIPTIPTIPPVPLRVSHSLRRHRRSRNYIQKSIIIPVTPVTPVTSVTPVTPVTEHERIIPNLNSEDEQYDTPLNILLVLPSIGDHNFLEKLSILKHNIKIILSTAPSRTIFQLQIFCYKLSDVQLPIKIDSGDPTDQIQAVQLISSGDVIRDTIQEAMEDLPARLLPLKNIKIKVLRGYLGQFLFQYVKPINISSELDYVFLFLDDIKLSENFKLDLYLEVYDRSGLDILSPALTINSPYSYQYMLQNCENTMDSVCDKIRKVRQTSILEFYSYLMTYSVYKKYHETFLTENSKWMWGIDLAFTGQNFKVGIYDYMTMQHYYKTLDHKEHYGKHVPLPLHEKKLLNTKFEFSNYELLDQINIIPNGYECVEE